MTESSHTFEEDSDNPITYGEEEITLYPATSLFFPDVKSIYDLAYSIYDHSVEDIYIYDPSTASFYLSGTEKPRLFFMEIDGQMYVNPDCLNKKGGPESFVQTSYIEITDQSEDRCSFIWHYPDVEGLNEPDQYYTFFYEKEYTAVYNDRAWRLTEVIRR